MAKRKSKSKSTFKCVYCGKSASLSEKMAGQDVRFCFDCYEANGGDLSKVNPGVDPATIVSETAAKVVKEIVPEVAKGIRELQSKAERKAIAKKRAMLELAKKKGTKENPWRTKLFTSKKKAGQWCKKHGYSNKELTYSPKQSRWVLSYYIPNYEENISKQTLEKLNPRQLVYECPICRWISPYEIIPELIEESKGRGQGRAWCRGGCHNANFLREGYKESFKQYNTTLSDEQIKKHNEKIVDEWKREIDPTHKRWAKEKAEMEKIWAERARVEEERKARLTTEERAQEILKELEQKRESRLSEMAFDICDAIIEDGRVPARLGEKTVRTYIKEYIKEGRYAPEVVPTGKEFDNMVEILYQKMSDCYNWDGKYEENIYLPVVTPYLEGRKKLKEERKAKRQAKVEEIKGKITGAAEKIKESQAAKKQAQQEKKLAVAEQEVKMFEEAKENPIYSHSDVNLFTDLYIKLARKRTKITAEDFPDDWDVEKYGRFLDYIHACPPMVPHAIVNHEEMCKTISNNVYWILYPQNYIWAKNPKNMKQNPKSKKNTAIMGKMPYSKGIIPREVERIYPYSKILEEFQKGYGEEQGRTIFYQWMRGVSVPQHIKLPPAIPAKGKYKENPQTKQEIFYNICSHVSSAVFNLKSHGVSHGSRAISEMEEANGLYFGALTDDERNEFREKYPKCARLACDISIDVEGIDTLSGKVQEEKRQCVKDYAQFNPKGKYEENQFYPMGQMQSHDFYYCTKCQRTHSPCSDVGVEHKGLGGPSVRKRIRVAPYEENPPQKHDLVGYIRPEKGEYMKMGIHVGAFDKTPSYEARDGQEFKSLYVHKGKVGDIIEGKREVASIINPQSPVKVWKSMSPSERLAIMKHSGISDMRLSTYLERPMSKIPKASRRKIVNYLKKYKIEMEQNPGGRYWCPTCSWGYKDHPGFCPHCNEKLVLMTMQNPKYFSRPKRPGYPKNGRKVKK